MRKFVFFLIGAFCLAIACHASEFREAKYKYLTASGAVTTNNKAGILKKVIVSGTAAGDAVNINDGATTKFTLIVPSNNDSVIWDSPDGVDVIFSTDIDVVYLTQTGYIYTTIVYREING